MMRQIQLGKHETKISAKVVHSPKKLLAPERSSLQIRNDTADVLVETEITNKPKRNNLMPSQQSYKLTLQPPDFIQDPQLFMQPLKPTEVRRTSNTSNRLRQKNPMNRGVGRFINSDQQDYRDFINYKPGEDMLNSDLPGMRASSMMDTRAEERQRLTPVANASMQQTQAHSRSISQHAARQTSISPRSKARQYDYPQNYNAQLKLRKTVKSHNFPDMGENVTLQRAPQHQNHFGSIHNHQNPFHLPSQFQYPSSQLRSRPKPSKLEKIPGKTPPLAAREDDVQLLVEGKNQEKMVHSRIRQGVLEIEHLINAECSLQQLLSDQTMLVI